MRYRCRSPGARNFKNYGGRGISVCARWDESFPDFFADMGPRPSPKHSLDRIDNSKGYEPGNVVWATRRQQNFNKRNNVKVEVDGAVIGMDEWASRSGLSYETMRGRVRRGRVKRVYADGVPASSPVARTPA